MDLKHFSPTRSYLELFNEYKLQQHIYLVRHQYENAGKYFGIMTCSLTASKTMKKQSARNGCDGRYSDDTQPRQYQDRLLHHLPPFQELQTLLAPFRTLVLQTLVSGRGRLLQQAQHILLSQLVPNPMLSRQA